MEMSKSRNEEEEGFEPWKNIKKDVEKVAQEIKEQIIVPTHSAASSVTSQPGNAGPSKRDHPLERNLIGGQRHYSPTDITDFKELIERAKRKRNAEPLSSPILFQSILSTLAFVLMIVWLCYGLVVLHRPGYVARNYSSTANKTLLAQDDILVPILAGEQREGKKLTDIERWARWLQLIDGSSYIATSVIGLQHSVNGCFNALIASKSQYETTLINFILLAGRCVIQTILPLIHYYVLGIPFTETWYHFAIGGSSFLFIAAFYRVWNRLWIRLDREEREQRHNVWRRIVANT